MPRRPLKFVISLSDRPPIRFGVRSHTSRPEITRLIGSCLIMWPYVEAEMAIALGTLLGTESEAALAVFQILRRSSNQREAVSEAAKATIAEDQQELIAAILDVHKSIETERNSIAHGILGVCDKIDDGVVWLPSNTQVLLRLKLQADKDSELDPAIYNEVSSKAFVYTANDIQQIWNDIRWLWGTWMDVTVLLARPHRRDVVYRRLCNQPRIAQSLENLRRRTNSSVQPQSPSPATNE